MKTFATFSDLEAWLKSAKCDLSFTYDKDDGMFTAWIWEEGENHQPRASAHSPVLPEAIEMAVAANDARRPKMKLLPPHRKIARIK